MRDKKLLSIFQVATGYSSWGGTERHILNLSQSLTARGHDVTIIVRPESWVEEEARKMKLPTYPISVMTQHDTRDYARLRGLLCEMVPDVVHVHCNSDILVHGFAARRERVPVRVLSRHLPYPFRNLFGAKVYSNMLFPRIVTVSQSVRNGLLKCGVSAHHVEVIHHGTDVKAFAQVSVSSNAMRSAIGLPENCVVVGIVGRISPEKGHLVLLEAAAKIKQNRQLCYVVIGEGPEEQKMRDLAKVLGIVDNVIFLGFRDDVNDVINAMDIIVVPSTWDEPCSAVIQQGMALSKPVIGTWTGGSPEMIVDGKTGILVSPSDADGLAEAIVRLCGDSDLRARMGAAGRARVEEFFTLDLMTRKLEDLYYREYERVGGSKNSKTR